MVTFSTKGQGVFLNPCVCFEDKIPEIEEYNERMESLFSEKFAPDYIVRFVAKPSIEAEYAFQICKIDSSVFEITTLTLKANLWNAKNTDSVYIKKRRIDEELVAEIDTLFKLLIDTALTKNAYGYGEGGDTYNLFYNSEGIVKCGEAWTPVTNSLLNEVIQVCDSLMRYAQGEGLKLRDLHCKVKSIIKQL